MTLFDAHWSPRTLWLESRLRLGKRPVRLTENAHLAREREFGPGSLRQPRVLAVRQLLRVRGRVEGDRPAAVTFHQFRVVRTTRLDLARRPRMTSSR